MSGTSVHGSRSAAYLALASAIVLREPPTACLAVVEILDNMGYRSCETLTVW